MSARPPSGAVTGAAVAPLLRLAAGDLRAEVSAQWGGSIAAFFTLQDGQERIDWLRPAPAGNEAVRLMASFPMVPFCNRLREGRGDYGPRPVALGPEHDGSIHRRHGLAWRLPWQVEAQSDSAVRLGLHHAAGEWPYAFACQQDIALDARHGLTLVLSVTNHDTVPMPLGMGHHCFLPDAAGARMALDTDAMWETDAEVLPTALARPSWLPDLAAGIGVAGLRVDNTFTGWRGTARVTWPGRGVGLAMAASQPLDMVTLFTPPGQDFFCIEPVSNVADWMHLRQRGLPHTGGELLAPGATRSATLRLTPLLDMAPATPPVHRRGQPAG
ncbi:aldose 1-epimerase [Acidovorax sacchari]|uniref:aldose 1-epimerase n=1 Tax=Acidovorax sacchari TaxID=3230736 RepID=UPI0039E41A75